jgi:isoleucyl-tRNA synthetase
MSDTPADTSVESARDYRETVFLPETPFPMRGGLPQKEPAIIEQWGDLYGILRAERQKQKAPLYVLHDGPPYANGDIHIGHALNKTLKDFVVRSRFCWAMTSTTCPAGTATACRSNGRSRRNSAPRAAARTRSPRRSSARCRAYAGGWIDLQKSSSSAWASLATSPTATPPWTSRPKRPSSPSSTSSRTRASSIAAPSR